MKKHSMCNSKMIVSKHDLFRYPKFSTSRHDKTIHGIISRQYSKYSINAQFRHNQRDKNKPSSNNLRNDEVHQEWSN